MTEEKRTITAEDLYQMELISSLEISPDGKHVIYAQQRVDPETEEKYNREELIRLDAFRNPEWLKKPMIWAPQN